MVIRRLQADYAVAASHPAPYRVKARLDDLALKHLPGALEAALRRTVDDGCDGVWLIRRLEVNVSIDLTAGGVSAEGGLAGAIAEALAAAIAGGGNGHNVLYFPDRPSYLARFLADAAEGQSSGRWYYAAFAGLAALPTAAALRTAVLEEPRVGELALRRLTPGARRAVLRCLSEADASSILDGVAAAATEADPDTCFEAARKALRSSNLADGGARQLLALYLDAAACGATGTPLLVALRSVLWLKRRLRHATAEESAELVGRLTRPGAPAGATKEDADALAVLRGRPPEWVKAVVTELENARADVPPAPVGDAATSVRRTPFGGALLLLPLLDELPVSELTADWPDFGGGSTGALVRLLVLASCLGQPPASLARDTLILDLVGLPEAPSRDALAEWEGRLHPALLRRFLERLAAFRASQGAAGGEACFLVDLSMAESRCAVLMDSPRGTWLLVVRHSDGRALASVDAIPATLLELDKSVRPSTEVGRQIICDPAFVDGLRAAFPGRPVVSTEDATIRSGKVGPTVPDDTDAILGRWHRVADDYRFLCGARTDDALPFTNGLADATAVAAHGVVRAFAWRLPGFSRSSLPFVYGNFLEFEASVEERAGERACRLGRPPLHLMLSLTGIDRGTFEASWLGGPRFVLYPEP